MQLVWLLRWPYLLLRFRRKRLLLLLLRRSWGVLVLVQRRLVEWAQLLRLLLWSALSLLPLRWHRSVPVLQRVRRVLINLVSTLKGAFGRFSFADLFFGSAFVRRCWLGMSVGLMAGMTGCASSSIVAEVLAAAYADTFQSTDTLAQVRLNPAYRYLRVEATGAKAALLVLGYLDASPRGDVEVWYSSSGEIIKLLHGRIVGTAGLRTDWRRVDYPQAPLSWSSLPPEGQLLIRIHDEFPGYRGGVTHQLHLKQWVGMPPIALAGSLPSKLAGQYDWYQEVRVGSTRPALPPSWYAVALRNGQRVVVYSQQCLSPTYCLQLQAWPVAEDGL